MIETIIGILSSIWFAIVSVFGFNAGTEQPKYAIIETLGDQIEIRRYEPRVAAEVTFEILPDQNARSKAFGIIAGYIFGANKGRTKIDMTSPVEIAVSGTKIDMTTPVEIQTSDKTLTMRFFMPSKYGIDDLPEPENPQIRFLELAEETAAALTFSGSTSEETAAAKTTELLARLQSSKWKPSGSPTAYFYNPPWTIPFLRTNEVIVPVTQ